MAEGRESVRMVNFFPFSLSAHFDVCPYDIFSDVNKYIIAQLTWVRVKALIT